MGKKQFGDYYLGLDIGTASVGWAVTDKEYEIQRINSKAMWGIRLYDTASTAESTRINRNARRRLNRKTWRLKMLQELFADEIAKVDPGFFVRLRESNLHLEDRREDNNQKYTLFADKLYSDIEYYKLYPTIYHLRNALIQSEQKFDVRLVYLAIQHILKHRGHFLLEGLNAKDTINFKSIYNELEAYITTELGLLDWHCSDIIKMENVIKDKSKGAQMKEQELKTILPSKNGQEKSIIKFLCGKKSTFSELFNDDELKECEKNNFSFKENNYEDDLPILERALGERLKCVELFKAIYDWGVLVNILGDKQYISEAKINVYKEHAKDLKTLKLMLRANDSEKRKLYNIIFRNETTDNYDAYKKRVDGYTQDNFCKYLKKELEKINEYKNKIADLKSCGSQSTDEEQLLNRVCNGMAFPKQTNKENGVIPIQVDCAELEAILLNAEKHLSFLKNVDEKGMSVKEKIVDIVKFRVPYYVDPLNGTTFSREKGRCWVVRKTNDKIYPWNFQEVIDEKMSAENFIKKMTAKCTYLIGEDVLPKNSLLYTEFMARNEINNLAIDGKRLPIDVINQLYEDLLENQDGNPKITQKKIENYLKIKNIQFDILSGIDKEVKTALRSFKDFAKIFGKDYVKNNREQIENIIKWITLFSEEKNMLKAKIEEVYPNITQENLKNILKLRYKDWGRLSQTFLDSSAISYVDTSTGEFITIISALRHTNQNLMQLLSGNNFYEFSKKIEDFNNQNYECDEKITYKTVEDLYVSPSVKRSIWQTYVIVDEIKQIMGHAPKRIFVEMAREEGKKERTQSRLAALQDLYKQCRNEEIDWKVLLAQHAGGENVSDLSRSLENKNDADLRRDRLFLYYTQMGRCMYTGEPIDLGSLYNDNVYDIDHIFPRSKTKDDSLDNRVLVKKELNAKKLDYYPIAESIRKDMQLFWAVLVKKKLISQKKYERLVRNTPLTEEELAGFINRQLVETRQSTKAVAELLKRAFPETAIVYVKAGNVSDFRQEFDMLKCRDVNDFHHAKDAYLNIVVGNVYYTRFTNNPLNFIKTLGADKYTLNTPQLYERDIKRGGDVAWVAGVTMQQVVRTMAKNNILFTRQAVEGKGQLFKVNPLKKGQGQLPLKRGLNIQDYGGYNSLETAHFMLVESQDKKGRYIRTIETIPIVYAKLEIEGLLEYLKNDLGLQNPRVLIPKIKKYSLFNIDGYLMHISGKTGNNLILYSALPLILSSEQVKYCKKIFQYRESIAECENTIAKGDDNNAVIAKHQARLDYYNKKYNINKQQNLILYDILLTKQKDTVYYNRPASQLEKLQSAKEVFVQLNISDQICVLQEIIKLFKCSSTVINLSLLGKEKNCGKISISRDITERKTAKLINQSSTGIFEKEVNLLEL